MAHFFNYITSASFWFFSNGEETSKREGNFVYVYFIIKYVNLLLLNSLFTNAHKINPIKILMNTGSSQAKNIYHFDHDISSCRTSLLLVWKVLSKSKGSHKVSYESKNFLSQLKR